MFKCWVSYSLAQSTAGFVTLLVC